MKMSAKMVDAATHYEYKDANLKNRLVEMPSAYNQA
jgi:hypothetical protein